MGVELLNIVATAAAKCAIAYYIYRVMLLKDQFDI